ncbi:terminase [Companilactobacillus suantsaicola]|uniref:Terminase n=1 Tax=Companilactobacillus suantsaicola TaxID=2487723 RepID=A0A4Z0JQ93_9LACO|nr:terminase small subunit [Companilactobacillus suantsaicola]TGD24084.1 terminase [Companilactobacillus suantsaicola]
MKKWEEAEKDYLAGMKYKDIATKYDVSVNTVKSWRSRHGWARGAPTKKSLHPKSKKFAPKIVDELEENGELNDKQKLFCLYYLQRFNATWAYQKAYEVEYSVANVNGSRMLVNASIQKQLSILKKQQASDLYFDVADIIQKYIQQANSDVTDVVDFKTVKKLAYTKIHDKKGKYEDDYGNYRYTPTIDPETGKQAYYYEHIINMKDSSEIDTSSVKSVKIDKGEAVVEMYDKQKALDSLMKYFKDDDIMRKARLRKIKADTDIARAKADILTGDNGSNESTVIIDDIGDDKDDNENKDKQDNN